MSSTQISVDNGRRAPYIVEITTHEVAMHGPDALPSGFTIVHLTDFHGGFGRTEAVYEEAIARIDALQPDLVLLTGDYIDDHPTVRDFPMREVLSRLHGRLGVFGSFGNHDHRRGVVGTRRLLEQSGVHVVNNENIEVRPGLWLAGIDDLDEGRPDLEKTLSGLPTDRTNIILSHHPRLIDRIPDQDALILSGHTHGAQIALPFPSPALVCRFHLKCRQVAGWYENGKAREYVSRGLGVTGRPFRFRCPAEIPIMTLVQSDTTS